MTLPGLRWSEQRIVQGSLPVGEVSTRCVGCLERFVAGEPYVARMIGPVPVLGLVAHPSCTERAEVCHPSCTERAEVCA